MENNNENLTMEDLFGEVKAHSLPEYSAKEVCRLHNNDRSN